MWRTNGLTGQSSESEPVKDVLQTGLSILAKIMARDVLDEQSLESEVHLPDSTCTEDFPEVLTGKVNEQF